MDVRPASEENYNHRASCGSILMSLLLLTSIVMIIRYPQESFLASLAGLRVWLNVVFPSLFPFFVISNLASSTGVISFLGVLLEPVMRPLFNVPGHGAFVVAMGYTSGAPLSASLAAELYRKKLCSKSEAERLIAFTSNPSPLFLLSAVAVGLLGEVQVGMLLLVSIYLTNLGLGMVLRFVPDKQRPKAGYPLQTPWRGPKLWKAIEMMTQARRSNPQPLGQLFADAVRNSFQTLSLVGGFIIIFSVLIEALRLVGIIPMLNSILYPRLIPLGLNSNDVGALLAGLVEMTNGTKMAAETVSPLAVRLTLIAFILGWQGLSIQAQVAAVVSGTGLSLAPFFLARCLHGFFAAVMQLLLLGPAYSVVAPVMAPVGRYLTLGELIPVWQGILFSSLPLVLLLLITVISIATQVGRGSVIFFRSSNHR